MKTQRDEKVFSNVTFEVTPPIGGTPLNFTLGGLFASAIVMHEQDCSIRVAISQRSSAQICLFRRTN